MNEHERQLLAAAFPQATESVRRANPDVFGIDHARDNRHSSAGEQEKENPSVSSELPRAINEELENVDDQACERQTIKTPAPHQQTGVSGMERKGRPSFRVSMSLHVSNYGRRDPTGAYETVLDLLVALRGRLGERLATGNLVSSFGTTRKRRSRASHRKAELKPPF